MPDNETIRLEIPAQHRFLGLIAVCIGELLNQVPDLPDREMLVYNIQLAVQEAAANVVDHAYQGGGGLLAVELTILDEPLHIRVDLFDHGITFDPSSVAVPSLVDAQVRGYGLYLIHALMDEVSYQTASGQNRWRLLKRLA